MQDYFVVPNLGLPQLTEHNRLFNVLPVIISNNHDRRISSVHWHDYLQIFFTISGTYRHVLDGVAYPQASGSIMLIFPYMNHQLDTSASDLSELNLFQISVRKDMWQKYCVPFLSHSYDSASFDSFCLRPIMTVTGKDREILEQICTDLLAEYNKQIHMQANKLLTLVGKFLEVLVRDADRAISVRERNTICTRNECIDEAMVFLKQNAAHGVSLDDISKHAAMSRRSFTAGFSTVSGKTTHDYLNLLRMQNAVEMLRKTPNSIAQIAEETGYYDSSHFRLKCVEMYGVSPHTLRLNLSQWSRYDNERYQNSMDRMRWTQIFDEASMQRHMCSMSFY